MSHPRIESNPLVYDAKQLDRATERYQDPLTVAFQSALEKKELSLLTSMTSRQPLDSFTVTAWDEKTKSDITAPMGQYVESFLTGVEVKSESKLAADLRIITPLVAKHLVNDAKTTASLQITTPAGRYLQVLTPILYSCFAEHVFAF